MKILVTGAAGYIGSNLCDFLLERGHDVVGVDNFNNFYNPKLKEYNIKTFKDNPKFILYRADILDMEKMSEIFSKEKPEAVVHLAAWAGVTKSLDMPAVYVRNNIEGTVNLAEASIKHKVKSFIFASTSSVYGSHNPTPFIEDMRTDHPLSPYPATKKACEVMLSSYQRNFGLNVTIFRIFNPLGPRIRPDLAMPKLIRSCLYGEEFSQYWSDPTSTGRDYTYVVHMLEAMEHVCKKPFEYEIFNLGNSNPVNLDELRKTVEKVVGKPVNIKVMPSRKGEMIVTFADVSKARKMIGYNPVTSIEELVRIYYDWFTKQEDWYKKGEF